MSPAPPDPTTAAGAPATPSQEERRPSPWPWVALLVLALAGLQVFTPLREADWWLSANLPASTVARLGETPLRLVDVPHSGDVTSFRRHLTGLATHLAAASGGVPDALVLDIAFGRDAGDAPAAQHEALLALLNSLQDLQARGTKVFAAVAVHRPDTEVLDPQYLERHAPEVYLQRVDGYGHTRVDWRDGLLAYEPYLAIGAGELRPALQVIVAESLPQVALKPDALQGRQRLALGDTTEVARITWRWEDGRLQGPTGEAAGPAPMARRVVVVGSLAADRHLESGRAGPELLVWALHDLLRNLRNDGPARVLNSPWLTLGLMGVAAALAAIAVAAMARRLPAARGGEAPWTSVVGALVALALLLAVTGVAASMGHTYVQHSPVLASGWLAALCAQGHLVRQRRWGRKTWEARLGVLPTDVFISYSHTPGENAAWVEKHLHQPLSRLRRADGRPLEVFFDRYGIRQGQHWPWRLSEAIEQSKVFVPIYTAAYFDKPYCLGEAKQALAQAWRDHALGVRTILPVRRETPASLPDAYRSIQHLDTSQPGWADELAREVLDSVNRRLAMEAAPDVTPRRP